MPRLERLRPSFWQKTARRSIQYFLRFWNHCSCNNQPKFVYSNIRNLCKHIIIVYIFLPGEPGFCHLIPLAQAFGLRFLIKMNPYFRFSVCLFSFIASAHYHGYKIVLHMAVMTLSWNSWAYFWVHVTEFTRAIDFRHFFGTFWWKTNMKNLCWSNAKSIAFVQKKIKEVKRRCIVCLL